MSSFIDNLRYNPIFKECNRQWQIAFASVGREYLQDYVNYRKRQLEDKNDDNTPSPDEIHDRIINMNDFTYLNIKTNDSVPVQKSNHPNALCDGVLFNEELFANPSDNWRLQGRHFRVAIPVNLSEYSKKIVKDFKEFYDRFYQGNYHYTIQNVNLDKLYIPLCTVVVRDKDDVNRIRALLYRSYERFFSPGFVNRCEVHFPYFDRPDSQIKEVNLRFNFFENAFKLFEVVLDTLIAGGFVANFDPNKTYEHNFKNFEKICLVSNIRRGFRIDISSMNKFLVEINSSDIFPRLDDVVLDDIHFVDCNNRADLFKMSTFFTVKRSYYLNWLEGKAIPSTVCVPSITNRYGVYAIGIPVNIERSGKLKSLILRNFPRPKRFFDTPVIHVGFVYPRSEQEYFFVQFFLALIMRRKFKELIDIDFRDGEVIELCRCNKPVDECSFPKCDIHGLGISFRSESEISKLITQTIQLLRASGLLVTLEDPSQTPYIMDLVFSPNPVHYDVIEEVKSETNDYEDIYDLEVDSSHLALYSYEDGQYIFDYESFSAYKQANFYRSYVPALSPAVLNPKPSRRYLPRRFPIEHNFYRIVVPLHPAICQSIITQMQRTLRKLTQTLDEERVYIELDSFCFDYPDLVKIVNFLNVYCAQVKLEASNLHCAIYGFQAYCQCDTRRDKENRCNTGDCGLHHISAFITDPRLMSFVVPIREFIRSTAQKSSTASLRDWRLGRKPQIRVWEYLSRRDHADQIWMSKTLTNRNSFLVSSAVIDNVCIVDRHNIPVYSFRRKA